MLEGTSDLPRTVLAMSRNTTAVVACTRFPLPTRRFHGISSPFRAALHRCGRTYPAIVSNRFLAIHRFDSANIPVRA